MRFIGDLDKAPLVESLERLTDGGGFADQWIVRQVFCGARRWVNGAKLVKHPVAHRRGACVCFIKLRGVIANAEAEIFLHLHDELST